MTILASQQISQSFIKMRWLEPYTSAGLNSKTFKSIPRGIYRGFEVTPGPGDKFVTVGPTPIGSVSGYVGGNADAASGWSIAVHESIDGFNTTLAIPQGVSGSFSFDLTAYVGSSVWLALDAQYQAGYATMAQVKVVTADELDANPQLLSITRVNVPVFGPITTPNIIYNDTNYPRVVPYASAQKDGFMSKLQAQIIEVLEHPNASNAFEEEFVVTSAGPQTILIPHSETYVIGGHDLFIFKNGSKLTKGRDFAEVDSGNGFGNSVQFLSNLRVDDRIVFRGQQYAVSLTNNMSVLDENSLIETNVTRLNFAGTGVTVVPDGSGQAKVIIPSVTTSGTTRIKFNTSATTVAQYRIVSLASNGSIVPCNPRIPGLKPFAMNSTIMPMGASGHIFVDGVVTNGVAGLGFNVGDDLYVSHVGDGSLTNAPPDPLVGRVFRVGVADCSDGEATAIAVDFVFDKQRAV